MSLPPGSPEALYHAIPQVDDNANASQIELEGESSADAPIPPTGTDPPLSLVDSRIRWTYFILGSAVLLPWNVIITAMPFFLARLANSSLRSSFASYLTTSFTLSNFVFLAHATLISKHTIPSRQTHTCIVWLTILNLSLTISTFFVLSPGVFFAFVILNGVVQASFGAYLQTSVIAVASLFGPPAVQAMMSGQAAAAVAISGVQVVSAAASVLGKPRQLEVQSDGSAEERSAFVFFSLSTLFLLVSAILHRWFIRTSVYQHVAAALETQPKISASGIDHGDEGRGLISSNYRAGHANTYSKSDTLRVARQNIIYEVAVAYVFAITLAVFPPITTSVRPTNPATHPLLFSAIHFLVFNIGDFLGRYVCSFPKFLIWSARQLLMLSAARTLFIPLFLMCNVQRGNSTGTSMPIINSDLLFMLLLFIFGWSNGYVSSLCLMAAPSLDHNPRLRGNVEDVDIAAAVASFCLVGGLAIGSLASFVVKGAICGCNPFTQ